MAFQIKNWPSIVAGAINHVRGVQVKVTDFNVGSVVRTIIEAVATEIDQLYQQMFTGLKEAIPVATYQSFNFSRLPAAPASGTVRVTITASAVDTLIPAGTIFTTSAARTTFVSLADVTILAAATTGDVAVAATLLGALGNIAAASTFACSPRPSGFVSAINALPFANGREIESDAERKQRFVDYVTTLQRATIAALKYGAKTVALYNASGLEIERVKAVSVIEPYLADITQPIALVNVFVHNGEGSTSSTLATTTAQVLYGYVDPATGTKIPGWQAAGIQVVVARATETPLNVTSVKTADPGFDPAALVVAVTNSITRYILGLDIGETFIRFDAVILASGIAGVANITGLPADTTVAMDHKLMPGTITITHV